MIQVMLKLQTGEIVHAWLPRVGMPYQIDTAAWMGLRRIRKRRPEIPPFEGLDVFLNGNPVHTDHSEELIAEDRQVTILLQPRDLKHSQTKPDAERLNQYFIME
jgi:hypothetical protein